MATHRVTDKICRHMATIPFLSGVTVELTIEKAAALMDKTPRQVRYMIQKGRLRARKEGKRWYIDRKDLPEDLADPVQRQQRRLGKMRDAVEDALGTGEEPRYSMTSLKAFGVARTLLFDLRETYGPEHPAAGAIEAVPSRQRVGPWAGGCTRNAGWH